MSLIDKLFLTKEIVSKEGVVHFRRYRLLKTPWFAIYIHNILQSDMDFDPHNHPWHFTSLILSGSYEEKYITAPDFEEVKTKTVYPGTINAHKADTAHKLTLKTNEVWSFVVAVGKWRTWGYQTPEGFIDFITYRKLKNERS